MPSEFDVEPMRVVDVPFVSCATRGEASLRSLFERATLDVERSDASAASTATTTRAAARIDVDEVDFECVVEQRELRVSISRFVLRSSFDTSSRQSKFAVAIDIDV